jgi:hypothetical protein
VTDRCREERKAALRRLIEDAEASGISEGSVEAILAEARVLPKERGHQWDRRLRGGAPSGRQEREKVK